MNYKKLLILLFLSPIAFGMLTGCKNGGSSTDSGTEPGTTGMPSGFTMSSLAEGGSSAAFKAELLEQSPSSNNTGIILVHGRGGNPDSAVVKELRNDLFARGFTTLSIQAPFPAPFTEGVAPIPPFQNYIDDVNASNDVFLETYARIRTAINTLAAKGIDKIILVGFSMGSRMVSAHLANGIVDEIPIVGMIGVGMYGTSIDPLNVTLTISAATVPVLDIYGNDDTNAADTASARKAAYDGSGIGVLNGYLLVELVCDPTLNTINECHKLVGLKGTSTSPLELLVFGWVFQLLNPVAVS